MPRSRSSPLRVHHRSVDLLLVRGEHAGLAQHRVDQRGLAVVDVGDDGDVADVGAGDLGHGEPREPSYQPRNSDPG